MLSSLIAEDWSMRSGAHAVLASLALLAGAAHAAPGRLLAAEPMAVTPAGIQAWRIRYETSDGRGAIRQVTGIVAGPREAPPAAARPVIAWSHGTWGVAERCAPSLSPKVLEDTPGLKEAVATGYVVVAPDYPGLGSAGAHPYLVGADTAQSVLDAVRAARAIPGAAAGSRAVVWGESQGGHAALWTGALVRRYAPDVELLGVAAAAPPTDLARNLAQAADPASRAMLASFTGWSWSRHFGAPLDVFGKKPIQSIMLRLAENNCIELGKTPRLGTILGVAAVQRQVGRVQLDRVQPWGRLLRQNSVPISGIDAPVLIVQGEADRLVAPAVTRDYARRACRTGMRLRYLSLPAAGHVDVTRTSVKERLDWIGARFAGRAMTGDCRAV
jgi:acetyl esterase/lipase